MVLNACYSHAQATGIAEQIDVVIGTSSKLTDDTAVTFAASFYQALAYGRSIQTAFELGANTMQLYSLHREDTVQLIANHADPSTIFL